MHIVKLKYTTKEEGINDLLSKGLYVQTEEGLNYGENALAIVHVTVPPIVEGTYDEQGNVLTEPTYVEGYHIDVALKTEMVFTNEVFMATPCHEFAGHQIIEETL